jgi:hypothetical protein
MEEQGETLREEFKVTTTSLSRHKHGIAKITTYRMHDIWGSRIGWLVVCLFVTGNSMVCGS